MSHKKSTRYVFPSLVLMALMACSSSEKTSAPTAAPAPESAEMIRDQNAAINTATLNESDRPLRTGGRATNRDVNPTNSRINERDRHGLTMTPDRQSEGTKSDVEITREIRRAIVKDDSFSMNAKNIKIITKNGLVHLRGPVANSAESEKLAAIAQSQVGAERVKNQLEIARQ